MVIEHNIRNNIFGQNDLVLPPYPDSNNSPFRVNMTDNSDFLLSNAGGPLTTNLILDLPPELGTINPLNYSTFTNITTQVHWHDGNPINHRDNNELNPEMPRALGENSNALCNSN